MIRKNQGSTRKYETKTSEIFIILNILYRNVEEAERGIFVKEDDLEELQDYETWEEPEELPYEEYPKEQIDGVEREACILRTKRRFDVVEIEQNIDHEWEMRGIFQ